jgi:hypothetical protein
MRLSRFLLAASVWLASVVAVAAVSWFAIDSAGRQVSLIASDAGQPARTVVLPAAEPALPDDGLLAPIPVDPSATPSPTITPTLGSPVATSPDSTPEPRSSSSTTRRPSQDPTRPSPTRTSPAPRPGDPRAVTVRTRGGTVTVTCERDKDIDFRVTPYPGWRGSGEKTGHQSAEIAFTRTDDEIKVHATCDDGRPRTRVDEGTA